LLAERGDLGGGEAEGGEDAVASPIQSLSGVGEVPVVEAWAVGVGRRGYEDVAEGVISLVRLLAP
jgi:hypothetical protein